MTSREVRQVTWLVIQVHVAAAVLAIVIHVVEVILVAEHLLTVANYFYYHNVRNLQVFNQKIDVSQLTLLKYYNRKLKERKKEERIKKQEQQIKKKEEAQKRKDQKRR